MRFSMPAAEVYHPWRVLRTDWAHINLVFSDDLPPGRLADTDGLTEIRMRRRLLQVERRCALQHELIHLERRDTGTCPPGVEDEINREAARRLIPWNRLLAAVAWARSERELADELWVTTKILEARAETLTADELLQLARAAHGAP